MTRLPDYPITRFELRRLVERAAPFPAIGRTRNGLHTQPMVRRVTTGIACDDHVIAGVQRFARHTLTVQLTASAPLDGPPLDLAFLVRSLDVNERVRITEEKLDEVTLNGNCLIFEIGRREGMVRLNAGAGHQG